MRQIFSLFVVSLLLRPLLVFAATDGADLGVMASKIRFSKDTLIAGDTVRVYATIENKGTEDVSGYLLFYAGSEEIGKSQVVSVVSGGNDEQVWVDFTVPYGSFNIRAEIQGTDPADVNTSNDIALTALYEPMIDEDRDGVSDAEDNCPDEDNADQKDSDGDGEGDACDDDDDNDGLSDAVEEEMATDPTKKDSDGDGVEDAKDAYPNDPTRTVKEVSSPVSSVAPSTPVIAPAQSSIPETPTPETPATLATPGTLPEPEVGSAEIHLATGGSFQISPRAAFAFVQEDWKTYSFQSLSILEDGSTLAWDFGDGVTSAADQVTHTFRKPGSYRVALYITSTDGSSVEDAQTIDISPFHLGNPLIQIALALLAFLLCSSAAIAFRRSRRGTIQPKAPLTLKDTDEKVIEESSMESAEKKGSIRRTKKRS